MGADQQKHSDWYQSYENFLLWVDDALEKNEDRKVIH